MTCSCLASCGVCRATRRAKWRSGRPYFEERLIQLLTNMNDDWWQSHLTRASRKNIARYSKHRPCVFVMSHSAGMHVICGATAILRAGGPLVYLVATRPENCPEDQVSLFQGDHLVRALGHMRAGRSIFYALPLSFRGFQVDGWSNSHRAVAPSGNGPPALARAAGRDILVVHVTMTRGRRLRLKMRLAPFVAGQESTVGDELLHELRA